MIFAILNGPNLNWLGKRESVHYDQQSWPMIWENLLVWAEQKGAKLEYFQSNHEGALIDKLQSLEGTVDGILFNPGAYAHTSIALRDCVAALPVPVIEVHLSKIHRREPFRHHSYIADVAQACIVGFGADGYRLGLEILCAQRMTHVA